jgi:uncharacterized protein YcbK (DUF882 family)
MLWFKDIGRQPQAMSCNRREFLRIGSGVAAALMLPAGMARAASHSERSLSFYILRDHRTGDVHDMDQGLLDLLYLLQTRVESRQTFQIISGYRSPKTNAMLSGKSKGVAKRSYHMQGKAIDIRLNGCDLKQLHKAALSLKAGGVGYYPSSDFIHVDVGRVRRW